MKKKVDDCCDVTKPLNETKPPLTKVETSPETNPLREASENVAKTLKELGKYINEKLDEISKTISGKNPYKDNLFYKINEEAEKKTMYPVALDRSMTSPLNKDVLDYIAGKEDSTEFAEELGAIQLFEKKAFPLLMWVPCLRNFLKADGEYVKKLCNSYIKKKLLKSMEETTDTDEKIDTYFECIGKFNSILKMLDERKFTSMGLLILIKALYKQNEFDDSKFYDEKSKDEKSKQFSADKFYTEVNNLCFEIKQK